MTPSQFIAVFIGVALFKVGVRLILLAAAPYPREVKTTRIEDAIALAGSLIYIGWAWITIH